MSKRSETMQTPKARSVTTTSEVAQRVSPRTVRQLRPNPLETDSTSSSTTLSSRIPKDRSPKVIERKSPRSPVPEKKRPSRIPELESQISELREELKEAREQLRRSESGKKEAELEAEDSKNQLSALSSKLDELRSLSSSEESRLCELQRISDERDQAWRCELDSVQKQRCVDSTALTTAVEEIQWLRVQLEMASASEAGEIQSLKTQLNDSRGSEAEARDLAEETLLRLEAAKSTMDSIAAELVNARARVDFLEGEVNRCDDVGEMRSAMEEEIRSTVEARTALELLERMRSEMRLRESEIEELKANLMDKETELQGITAENDELSSRLERDSGTEEEEVKKLRDTVADLKANLMDKETEIQSVAEENGILRSEIAKSRSENRDLETARSGEREALARLGAAGEEAERAGRKAARVAEQLDAAQAARAEMEAELRRLKVQSDQWRKAAEAAAAMLSAGNNNNGKYMERSGSMDNKYSPGPGKFNSLYSDDIADDDADDDLIKKKNGNVLKKIGVLWKKPHK